MSRNKTTRNNMVKKYGNKCMIEELGIRKIPRGTRRKIKGYKKFEDEITFHHIKERAKGGPTTEENGALLKGYNHSWLHTLPEEEKEEINRRLQEYKLTFMTINTDGFEIESGSIEFDPNADDLIILPVHKQDKKIKYERAKAKKEFKDRIREDLEMEEDLDV